MCVKQFTHLPYSIPFPLLIMSPPCEMTYNGEYYGLYDTHCFNP